MDTSIETYMRMGLVHFMAFPECSGGGGPWEETVRHIALNPFFSAIEITHIEDPRVRERVRDLIHLAHLSVGYGAHPAILGQKLDLNSLNEKARSKAVAVLTSHLDEAIYMGAESFVVLSGKDPGADLRSSALDALVTSLGDLCAYSASRKGPRIVAEVFDCDIDKCCLLGPADLARRVAERMSRNHTNFGLLVDLSHIPLLRESPAEALEPVKDYLVGAHLGNAVLETDLPAYGDYHPIFGTPGSANDVPEMADFLRTLLRIGFLDGGSRPIVSFEVKPMEGQDPLVVLANAQRVMKEAWALI